MNPESRYSIVIEWSDEDAVFVVTLPEFPGSHTHGATYTEALANGQTVLALLVEAMQQEGHPLPTPARYQPTLA
ncbi:MAG: type II toxin-antitoxin system HicB family antitoxin [Caldilinea sp.]|jgi:predicted RNase H-like HicB family nuclease